MAQDSFQPAGWSASCLEDYGPGKDSGLEFWFMDTLPLSEVKARLSEIAEEVERTISA